MMNANIATARPGFQSAAGSLVARLHQAWNSNRSKKAALAELGALSPRQLRDVGLYRDTRNTVRRLQA
jgi:uncharacterized protein YjiS (DUF1127 family)